jgi:hypothetical protein
VGDRAGGAPRRHADRRDDAGGRVYTIDPKSGKSKLFATLSAEHVWALALDAKNGTVYAGLGGPGKIAAIDAGGKARAIWDSGDKHVVSLLVADDKHLYAGTSEEAILYKVGLDGRAEALADFDAEEVRSLARHGGALYAAVNDFERSGGGAPLSPGAAARAARHEDHRRGVRLARVGGVAAAAWAAQGEGGALPHRSRRAHGADVLDPRRLLHRDRVRRRGPRVRRHRQRRARLARRRRPHRRAGDRRL